MEKLMAWRVGEVTSVTKDKPLKNYKTYLRKACFSVCQEFFASSLFPSPVKKYFILSRFLSD